MSKQHFVSLDEKQIKDIVVIATHPDDETLGAGGTLLKHKAQGHRIHCIFCTDIFETFGFDKAVIAKREQEIEAVSLAYGFDSVHRLGFPTMQLDTLPRGEIIGAFSAIFKAIEPHIVYLPFCYDVHSDHRVIFECAFACTKSFRYPSIERVLMMEVLSESEFAPSLSVQSFMPNVFVDISPYFAKKCEIMSLYESEVAPLPFPRALKNIESLALLRGSTRGADAVSKVNLSLDAHNSAGGGGNTK
ncbi:PIG-L deacetylase family protein [Helicobacter jaachi]|uniref:PIG-L deacetylase family protein n=1 Tax=Helicobacter jaachi TaxID=1677920 RepID=UPI0018843BAA|nr:PIG-L deacetylase family protein [Helicobacter jaachi]